MSPCPPRSGAVPRHDVSRHALRLSTALALAMLAAGCMVGPDYKRPEATVPVAYKEMKGWKPATPADDMPRTDWWTAWNDPVLNRLEARVAVDNQTVRAYEASWRQARAIVAEVRSGLAPSATFNPDVTRQHASNNDNVSYEAIANLSWEIDVWGRIRRQVESSTAAAQVSAADLANARLSAQADVASYYLQMRYQDSLKQLLNQTAQAYERSLTIVRNQYEAGTAARSDVLTAQTQLLSTRADAIAAESNRAVYEHALAVLTGTVPSALDIAPGSLTRRVPKVPVALPSTLLERRPDIAAAERTMAEQNAQIGVAVAAYYPDINLAGLAGYSSGGINELLTASNQVWSLAASGNELLFDGGGRKATVQAAREAYDASVASYREAVLSAFRDVEDALAQRRIVTRQIAVQQQAVTAAREAVTISLNEYAAGTQDYTTVATAQAAALSNERTLLNAELNRQLATVDLIRALGGGWSTADLPTAREIEATALPATGAGPAAVKTSAAPAGAGAAPSAAGAAGAGHS